MPFSKHLVKLNRYQIPYIAGIFQLVLSIALMFVGGFDLLTDMLIFVIWMFYTLVFVAVIKLRHTEPELARPYKGPLYPVIPIIAILGGVFILVMTLLSNFWLAMTGIGLTLIGLPVYFWMQHKNKVN